MSTGAFRAEEPSPHEHPPASAKSPAAWSVLVFGLYMAGEGALLMGAPDVLLGLLGLPHAVDAWPRVVGLALVVLATYYVFAFWRDDRGFFRLSGFVRVAQFFFFVALYGQGLVRPMLVGTAGVELLSGGVTLGLLRAAPRASKARA